MWIYSLAIRLFDSDCVLYHNEPILCQLIVPTILVIGYNFWKHILIGYL